MVKQDVFDFLLTHSPPSLLIIGEIKLLTSLKCFILLLQIRKGDNWILYVGSSPPAYNNGWLSAVSLGETVTIPREPNRGWTSLEARD